LQFGAIFEKMTLRGDGMRLQLKHSPRSILNQQFNVDFKGYSPIEVDRLLDEIIRDYEEFDKTIETQQALVLKLQQENARIQSLVVELQSKSSVQTSSEGLSQSDVLKRLARLEEQLYKQNND
jgi:DivIVA domain-containing protein